MQKIFSVFGQDLGNTHQADHRVVWRQMKEVVNLSGPARVRWAERKAPEDFRSWWRYCTRLTAHRVSSVDHVRNREEFVAFVFWMWAHGLERGAFTPSEVALHQAEFVAGLEENHPDITDVPSHDALVQACLDHVTTAMTRDDKNLIDAASLLRHGLTDPARFDETHARRVALPGPGLQLPV